MTEKHVNEKVTHRNDQLHYKL